MAETESFFIQLLKKIIKIIFRNMGFSSKGATHHQHVVPFEDQWAIRAEGSEQVTEKFQSQDEAIERARTIAYNYRSDVIIHRKDGTIRERVTPTSKY